MCEQKSLSFLKMQNNNKADLNSYVNDRDIMKYLSFLTHDGPFVFMEEDIKSIDDLFRGRNSVAVILLKNPNTDIGHWVILRKDTPDKYTYFDCLGQEFPNTRLNPTNKLIMITQSKVSLMHRTNNICGLYVILFALGGNIPLDVFLNILTTNPKFTPDQIVNNLVRVDYTDNMIPQ